jgi:DNA-binding MarR family transcriptional regulator
VDAVDRILEQWRDVRPDLDSAPIAVIGRLSRLSAIVDRRLAENFARHDLEAWMYDVLATLRRSGPPYELTTGELLEQSMVTTGAMTNRVDRLEQRGLVERSSVPGDRRKVLVRLTESGLDVVDEVVGGHLDTERELLQSLTPSQQATLERLLRTALIGLGDRPVRPTSTRSPASSE